MFTGIVEESGRVQSIKPDESAIHLVVRSRLCGRAMKVGGSLAVNGCCLTVVKTSRARARPARCNSTCWPRPGSAPTFAPFTSAPPSTWSAPFASAAGWTAISSPATLTASEKSSAGNASGRDHVLDITAPPDIMRYIIVKGSVAVDGISLTVAAVRARSFRIWIIPHTLAVTALRERRIGDEVNLEADLLGKYVERFVATGFGTSS